MSKKNEEMVECRYSTGSTVYVPKSVFVRIVFNLRNPSDRYISYKEGVEIYRMSYKTFRDLVVDIGAEIPVGGRKLVNVRILEDYLECCRTM